MIAVLKLVRHGTEGGKFWPRLFECVAILSLLASCTKRSEKLLGFKGPSEQLRSVLIVPTLDCQIPEGKTVIWCASFQAAWKGLQRLSEGPIVLDNASGVIELLNRAADPAPELPVGSVFVFAGWNEPGMTDRLRTGLRAKFPHKKLPDIGFVTTNGFIVYACLEVSAKFPVPYEENDEPLTFTDRAGQKTQIRSFGIKAFQRGPSERVWKQPRLLFVRGPRRSEGLEFAVDLSPETEPFEVVVAKIKPITTLESGLVEVQNGITSMKTKESDELQAYGVKRAGVSFELDPVDELQVPELSWSISHSFGELERRTITSGKLKGRRLDVAWEDISFRLDRRGATLASESLTSEAAAVSTPFLFDRPFLLYMKLRNSKVPYFAMWVDNAELLLPWSN